MISYKDIKKAQQKIYTKDCSGCTKKVRGFLMGIYDNDMKLKFDCSSCGTVSEYVSANSPLVRVEYAS